MNNNDYCLRYRLLQSAPMESTPPEPHEKWTIDWAWFLFACGACAVLLGALTLCGSSKLHLDTADAFADSLQLVTALFAGTVGIRGETWDPKRISVLRRITWTGRLVLLALLFGGGVSAYQKFSLQPRLRDEAAADATAREQQKRKDAEDKRGRADTIARLERAQQQNELLTQIGDVRLVTADCAPEVGKKLTVLENKIRGDSTKGREDWERAVQQLNSAIDRAAAGKATTADVQTVVAAAIVPITTRLNDATATLNGLRDQMAIVIRQGASTPVGTSGQSGASSSGAGAGGTIGQGGSGGATQSALTLTASAGG